MSKERAEDAPTPNEETGYFSFGEYLKDKRRESGYNTKDAAEAVGISTVYLYKLESGELGNPGFRVAVHMAEVYGVSVSEMGEQQAKFERRGMAERIEELLDQVDFIKWEGGDLTELSWRSLIAMQKFLESVALKPLNNSSLLVIN